MIKTSLQTAHQAFTLIEILVVVGVIAIIFSLTVAAINPLRRFSEANNAQRASDISAILNAVHQYAANNLGALPTAISTTVSEISSTGASICVDIVPDQVGVLPVDPSLGDPIGEENCGDAYNTGYTIVKNASGTRVTVAAPLSELGETISITR